MKKLPIKAAKDVAKAYDLSQVIILARTVVSATRTIDHVITYGRTKSDCAQAAEGGNNLKRIMGWPESECRSRPRRWDGLKKSEKSVDPSAPPTCLFLRPFDLDIREELIYFRAVVPSGCATHRAYISSAVGYCDVRYEDSKVVEGGVEVLYSLEKKKFDRIRGPIDAQSYMKGSHCFMEMP